MRRDLSALLVALSLVLFTAACGGGDDAPDADAPADDAMAEAVTPAGSSVIAGAVSFTGTAPEPQPLNLDKECEDLRDDPALAQSVVVNDNGTLRWVFVYVKEGLEGQTFATPTEPVVFDQQGCMYTPHVFGVQTGQPIQILNSDPLLHNIHALPEENRPFNFGMPRQGDERTREFRTPEVMVRIKCDVHPWMSAYAGVLDHPYYATTGEDGSFRIEGLPAGTYTVETWHEEYGTQTQQVTVGDGEEATADFSYAGGTS
ncbi:MAG: carboxypeptidase regulatory-like domain-containing protein [Rhodothermales bacterium]|nr:carboxypeptidase regulatory-like domain-containing protein [Rhodothermales bacterium]